VDVLWQGTASGNWTIDRNSVTKLFASPSMQALANTDHRCWLSFTKALVLLSRERQLCSGCWHWRSAAEFTLAGVKQTPAVLTSDGINDRCKGCCGRPAHLPSKSGYSKCWNGAPDPERDPHWELQPPSRQPGDLAASTQSATVDHMRAHPRPVHSV